MDVTSEKSIESIKRKVKKQKELLTIPSTTIDAKIKGSKNILFENFNLKNGIHEVMLD